MTDPFLRAYKNLLISFAVGGVLGILLAAAAVMFWYERDYDPYSHEGTAYHDGRERIDGTESMVVFVLDRDAESMVSVVGCPGRPDGSPNLWNITDVGFHAMAIPGEYVPIYYQAKGDEFAFIGWADRE